MKIGLIPINIGFESLEQIIGVAQLAESVGVESVWTFEHVIVPHEYDSKYPYNRSGSMGVGADTVFVDPLIALSAVAATTKKIRLGTGVNIVAQTNPMLLAKQAASLDFISGGRFMLGAGIGWLKEEFRAMGTPWEKRGARFDDYIAAMRKVWSGETVEHKSEFVDWTGFKSFPTPVQKPFPVIMGGNKGKIFERIATLGDGWFAPTGDPKELAPQLDQLKAACKKADRDYNELELTIMWPGQGGVEALKPMQDLGVARAVVPIMALGPNPADAIKKLGDDVIAKL
jgi:probable F420-dependent oxidoreductase